MEYTKAKSMCCGKDPWAVYWNRFNGVVQCHACGEVWLPAPKDK